MRLVLALDIPREPRVEARRALETETPDLIIVDVMAPGMNGFAFCRQVRGVPRLEKVLILMLSTLDRESNRYWGLKQGASEYLSRPVEDQVLLDTVRRLLADAL